ncbi:MAG: hypothetical protein HQL55_00520 [Magnetococcales bacterium]|nr:hypothetical protein [Magnetococcales bacterium]
MNDLIGIALFFTLPGRIAGSIVIIELWRRGENLETTKRRLFQEAESAGRLNNPP